MQTKYFLILIIAFLYTTTFAQQSSAELFLEIPSEVAKYQKFMEDGNVRGPSSIEVDFNGDVYIGGLDQILVYDHLGNYLRTIVFDKRLMESVSDIAVSQGDKLYVLTNHTTIYIVNKNNTDISKGNIEKRIYIKTGKGLCRIWLTKDNQCLIGWVEDKYYIYDENDITYNEKNSEYIGIPTYSTSLKEEFPGTPLKYSSRTISKNITNKGVLDIELKEIGSIMPSNPPSNTVDLYNIFPEEKKEIYIEFTIEEVIGSEKHPYLYVRGWAKLKNEFNPEEYGGGRKSKIVIIVITKSGEFIDIIENIPQIDVVSILFSGGKRFNFGPDGYLYFLITEGNESDLETLHTKIYRWRY